MEVPVLVRSKVWGDTMDLEKSIRVRVRGVLGEAGVGRTEKFSGLISRWIMFLEWRYCRILRIW